jgi:hypothetical protein
MKIKEFSRYFFVACDDTDFEEKLEIGNILEKNIQRFRNKKQTEGIFRRPLHE